MPNSLRLADVRHFCQKPSTDHLPTYGDRHQVMARWRCPECGARWRYEASFLHNEHMYWERSTGPSWRWKRRERRRLHAEALAALDPQETER